MVGDGINDVLVMKEVSIGIVMGGGIDVVLEIVDVVLIYNCLIELLGMIELFCVMLVIIC